MSQDPQYVFDRACFAYYLNCLLDKFGEWPAAMIRIKDQDVEPVVRAYA